jgi:hypothetical protein
MHAGVWNVQRPARALVARTDAAAQRARATSLHAAHAPTQAGEGGARRASEGGTHLGEGHIARTSASPRTALQMSTAWKRKRMRETREPAVTPITAQACVVHAHEAAPKSVMTPTPRLTHTASASAAAAAQSCATACGLLTWSRSILALVLHHLLQHGAPEQRAGVRQAQAVHSCVLAFLGSSFFTTGAASASPFSSSKANRFLFAAAMMLSAPGCCVGWTLAPSCAQALIPAALVVRCSLYSG